MNYNYNDWLAEKLISIKTELGFDDFDISVESEQTFLTHTINPKTIYVVTKYLGSNIQFSAEIQPVQIMILSEQNSLEVTKSIFNKFAEDWNWKVTTSGTTFVKHQYVKPIVMNNFNEVSFGYRSVLYMSATLTIMENVLDLSSLVIDNVTYTPISFSLVYSASMDSQQMPNNYVATSIKKASSFLISMVIPLTNTALVTKVISIINETDNGGSGESETLYGLFGGNENFGFSINLKNGVTISKSVKLNSAQINTAINQVPSLSLTFVR